MNESWGGRGAIVMFAKAPEPGEVKTRLMTHLSAEQAAWLHRAFIDDVGAMLGGVAAELGARGAVAYAPAGGEQAFEAQARGGFELIWQGEGDLGARLWRVARGLFEAGARWVIITGSDSPTMPRGEVLEAARRLESGAEVVLGPSGDGGYYLIGLSAAHQAPLEAIPWSSARTLEQTLIRCRGAGLRVSLLNFWYDVDTFEDLMLLKAHVLDYLGGDAAAMCSGTLGCLETLAARGYFDVESNGEDQSG
jgi:rSAM/selenodomain-associated transferase 1